VAKLAPRDLAQVLSVLPKQPENENVLVGYESADDAGVFRLSDSIALVQTLDFFTPVVDDAEIYGRVAAVNSLNDVYAMGGKPLTAMGIVCFPQKGDLEILGQIMRGGQLCMIEEGVAVLGGHTVDDQEIKFGYSVTGVVDPNKVVTNADAKIGDFLVLTKPIGTGAISTGIKRGVARQETIDAAIKAMTTTAAKSSEEMQRLGANACTDITGFGLLGHAYEVAKASDVCLEIDSDKVPFLPDVLDLISQGMLTRGDKNNREYVGDTIAFNENVSREMQSALYDPQTAGGLLISLEPSKVDEFIRNIEGSAIIGEVKPKHTHLLQVV
jgi:selenide,water dikinase